MLEVDADTPEGDKMPPALFLKGHAASMLVCLIDQETREKFLVLVKQRRIASGAHTYEHPAGMVDASDAPGITIPYAMLPSKDESKEDVEKWEKAVKVKHVVKWWPNQVHGFLAARSDLKDPAVEADYKKGYEFLLEWFRENL